MSVDLSPEGLDRLEALATSWVEQDFTEMHEFAHLCREAVPALVAEVRRLDAENARLREADARDVGILEGEGGGGMNKDFRWVKKQFLTDDDEPSTSTVVSFYGDIKWDKDSLGGNVSFLEISSCHERARLHRTFEMTHSEWKEQVRKLRDHVCEYLDFLESIPEDEV